MGRQERSDDPALDQQRHPEDGPDPFPVHRLVDVAAVLEALVGLVVGGEVGRPGLGDQPQQSRAQREPQPLELRGERAVGHLHVRRPLARAGVDVVEGQVGHVRLEQLTGPAHDGRQHGVHVAQGGEVVGGLVERGQLRLARALPGHELAQSQGDVTLAPGGLRVGACGDHRRDEVVVVGARRLVVEQLEERGHRASMPAQH